MDQHRLKILNNNRRRLPSHRPVDENKLAANSETNKPKVD